MILNELDKRIAINNMNVKEFIGRLNSILTEFASNMLLSLIELSEAFLILLSAIS